ncbi:MAG: CHAT domain-containing protein [Bacteroidia bacterium]
MRKFYLYIIFLFVANTSVLLSQDFQPTLKTLDSIYTYGNSDHAKEVISKKIIRLEQVKNVNALLLSKHYTLLGEIFHSASDIGKAYEYWIKGFNLIKNTYGTNSIYLAESYSLLARYYSFRINSDSAFYYAQKSITLCHSKKDSVLLIPVNKIYREYAYALKVREGKRNFVDGRVKARIYFDSANYFNERYFNDELYKSQLFQDIGNTYTDESLFNSKISASKKLFVAKENFKKANDFYDKALSIRKNALGQKHEKVAILYFVKGLSYDYCYGNDSVISALNYYQKGLCALSTEDNNTSIFSIPNSNYHFSNLALALILMRNRIDGFYCLYEKTKDIKYLEYCYKHSITAVELWEKTFKNFKTYEIHQALDVYGAAPFASSILYSNKYYQLTKNQNIKENVFRWIDLNKYSVLLKYQLENNQISFKSGNTSISEIQDKLKENEAVVEYYLNEQQLTCAVISKKSFELFPSNQTFKADKTIDSFLLNLNEHNTTQYCQTAKVLYDTIIAPYINHLPKEVNNLTIVPHGKLAQIPFDALIINQTSSYAKADFLIKYFKIGYSLSCNLLYSNKEKNLLNRGISVIKPEYTQLSDLPFSKKMVNKLDESFQVSNFALSDTLNTNSTLHIAAHAYCDYKNSRNSYVLLSDTQKLFLNEISNKTLKYKLAILNACETANGGIEIGEGVINYSRHLYLAGIKSTITTLWKVDDEATASTITSFYYNLKQGNSVLTSLHLAKLNYLNNPKSIDDYDPYYWAGLIYTGNDLMMESPKSNILLYCIIGSLAVISIIVLWLKLRA